MKVFTIGAGFVADHLPYPLIKKRLPLAYDWIESILSAYEPEVLINCIGKTGRPNVDWCESHKEETMNANVTIPLLLDDYCKNNNVHLINIGSGCIYFGESPHYQPEHKFFDVEDEEYCYQKITRCFSGIDREEFSKIYRYLVFRKE